MSQLIDVPGHGPVEFPDGMTDDQIVAAIKKNSMNVTPPVAAGKPSRQDLIDSVSKNGWGTGVPAAAERAGAAVNDFAAKYLPAPVAAGLGAASTTAAHALPMLTGGNLGGAAAGAVASPPMQGAARWLMQSAIKPLASDLERGNVAPAIQTMLQQGYNPTAGGLSAMRSKVGEYADQIKGILSDSTATVDKGAVAGRLSETMRRFENQVNPGSDLNAIQGAWTSFLTHPSLSGLTEIPVQLAQAIKQGTYRALGSKPYGELKGADIEAQKTLARGLKEEIATAVPEVAPLNAKEAELLNAIKVSQRRALMEANKDPVNLGAAIGAIHDPMSALGLWANSNAYVKSMLARGLYSASQGAPQMLGAGAGVLANYPQRGSLYQ